MVIRTTFVAGVILFSKWSKSKFQRPSESVYIGEVFTYAPANSTWLTYWEKNGSNISTSSPGPTKFIIALKSEPKAPLVTKT